MRPPRLTIARRPRTAFVLSGGAGLGSLQAGMLHALYDHGVTPDLLVGTSAGALNAAFVASRPQTPMTAIELARVWRTLQRHDVFPITVSSVARGLCRRHDHLISHRGLRDLIGRHLEFEDLADAAIPVHVVAFDPPAGPSWGRHSQAAGSSTMPHTYQYPKVTPLPKPKPADSTAW